MAGFKEEGDEEDIYSEESREGMMEDDELSAEEGGFMEGFEGGSKAVTCAHCKKIIIDPDDAIEREFDDRMLLFCSEQCYQGFRKARKGVKG